MIESGNYYTITGEKADDPLCATTKNEVQIASSTSTTPEDQQFLATVNPENDNQFSFQSVSQEAYVKDSNGSAKTNSSSAMYFTLTAEGDYYTISSADDSTQYLTLEADVSGTPAKFKKKDSKSKQKFKFAGADRRGPDPD